jgi:hypothetical protein
MADVVSRRMNSMVLAVALSAADASKPKTAGNCKIHLRIDGAHG